MQLMPLAQGRERGAPAAARRSQAEEAVVAKNPKPLRQAWRREKMVLRRIDPTWSGRLPRLSKPVPIKLLSGRDPADLVLARRHGLVFDLDPDPEGT